MQEEQRGHDMEEMDHFEFQAKQNVWGITTHSVRVLYIVRATKRVPSKNPISGYLIVPVYFMRSGIRAARSLWFPDIGMSGYTFSLLNVMAELGRAA